MWTILTLNHTTSRAFVLNSKFRFQSLLYTTFDSLKSDAISTYGSGVTIADDVYLKIISSPGVDQGKPLLFMPALPLPRLAFKFPGPVSIASLCCMCPFSKIIVTTSISLWVPKTVSNSCFDGWPRRPWAPWLEKRTVNASYRKKKRWLWMPWRHERKKNSTYNLPLELVGLF